MGEEQERKLRVAATNASNKSLPSGFHDILVKVHCVEAPFWGERRWRKEEEMWLVS